MHIFIRLAFTIIIFSLPGAGIKAQQIYFPPSNSNLWATLQPEELGWNSSKIPELYDLLEQNNTKAFLVLKDGKIVLEKYFASFTPDSLWYWASAGKTLTAFAIGLAQQLALLHIEDPVSLYLGSGWSSLPPAQEDSIRIVHLLSMTSGLDDGVANPDCTDPDCLQYLVPVATRWAYHNAPYTLLEQVIQSATGQTLNLFVYQKILSRIGMSGAFIPIGYNRVFFSTPRSMARFGVMILAKGTWEGQVLLSDQEYYSQMTTTSNPFNESYGYLWWLNGKETFMLPQLQFTIPGPLIPSAPSDMLIAAGKNGQFINVVPSQNLVIVRLGNTPDTGPVALAFNEDIWSILTQIVTDHTHTQTYYQKPLLIYPNPFSSNISVEPAGKTEYEWYQLFNSCGGLVWEGKYIQEENFSSLPAGIYVLRIPELIGRNSRVLIKN